MKVRTAYIDSCGVSPENPKVPFGHHLLRRRLVNHFLYCPQCSRNPTNPSRALLLGALVCADCCDNNPTGETRPLNSNIRDNLASLWPFRKKAHDYGLDDKRYSGSFPQCACAQRTGASALIPWDCTLCKYGASTWNHSRWLAFRTVPDEFLPST